jgi:hypothetical protein
MKLFACVGENFMAIESKIYTRELFHLGKPFLKAISTISMACVVTKILVIQQGIKRALIFFFNHRKSSAGSGAIDI